MEKKKTTRIVPPDTRHTITPDEFVKAAKGEKFAEADWFYRKKGKEIKDRRIFGDYELDDDQLYIVLLETLFFSGRALLLDELEETEGKVAFIFINCVLPGITLIESSSNDWIFIRTHMNDGIRVDSKSQPGNFRLYNSQCGYIHIDRNSKSSGIVISKGSWIRHLKIDGNSECGDVSINSDSECGNIEIDNSGWCSCVDVHDESVIGDLKISNYGELEELNVAGGGVAGEVKVYEHGKCGDIKIMNNSSCKDIRAEENGEIGDIWIGNRSQCSCIDIERNSKCKDLWLDKGSKSDYIWIYDESECGHILVEENSECGVINMEKKGRSGPIVIKQNSKSGFIQLEVNSEAAHISISENSQCAFIELDNNSKCGFVEIAKKSLIGPITVSGNSYLDSLMIKGRSQSGDIIINGGEVKKVMVRDNYCNVFLSSATVSSMQFTNCHLHKLEWQDSTKVELKIDSCKINHLRLYKTTIVKDAMINITNTTIYIVQMQRLVAEGKLLLSNIKASPAPFRWEPSIMKDLEENKPKQGDHAALKEIYDSRSKLLKEQERAHEEQLEDMMADPMQALHKKPIFRIVGSSLGKAEITGGDLTGFHFEYEDSKLLEVFINGTKIPRDKIGIYNRKPTINLPDEVYYKQKISIYNQLKRVFENQGDSVTSNWYHAKAMDNEKHLLTFQYANGQSKAPAKWFTEQGFNLLNFRLNKKSNNYGESWRTALWFSLKTLFVIYTIYYIVVNIGRPFDFSLSRIDHFIGNFFSFINVAHRIDFIVAEKELNSISKFLDSFGRMAILYCTYQFVTAFRRHGRRA